MSNPATTNQTHQGAISAVEQEAAKVIPVLALHFIPIKDYTTFEAELAITEGDLVFHFYATKEVNELREVKRYWLEQFPVVLEKVATEYFQANFPQLKAAYTEEQKSWWMRAYKLGMVLDPHKFAYKFLETLDAALHAEMAKSR